MKAFFLKKAKIVIILKKFDMITAINLFFYIINKILDRSKRRRSKSTIILLNLIYYTLSLLVLFKVLEKKYNI